MMSILGGLTGLFCKNLKFVPLNPLFWYIINTRGAFMTKLYSREKYLSRIRGFYHATDIIKVITGLRRCGKSSIMKLISRELIKNGINKENIIFISLQKKGFKSIHTPKKLEEKIDKLSEGIKGTKYLFIDEIQKVKGFEEVVDAYREEDDYSIFITGSNSYLLSGELSTYLTGRYIEFEICTLTFDEYIGMKDYFGLPVQHNNLIQEFDKYIKEGGFPRAVLIDNLQDKQTYVRSIIKEIFEKDIKKNKKIRNKELFNTIQTYIINNFGSKTSVGALCDYINKTRTEPIKKDTVYRYLDILENAKIISRCNRFDMKSKKSINGEEKYFLGDLSFYFATNVDGRINYGPVLENIVYNYAKSKRYQISVGQIGNLEVDFILRDQFDNYSYIQVAMTIYSEEENGIDRTQEREYRPLEQIEDNYPKYVLSLDYLMQKRGGIIHENIVDFMFKSKDF